MKQNSIALKDYNELEYESYLLNLSRPVYRGTEELLCVCL